MPGVTKLGIAVIKAYSPQAKGRVERSHAVYQDRFVKGLKLQGIRDIEGANQLLSDGFVNQLNEKFAKAAESDEDAHVPLSAHDDLDQILCWEYTRQLSNDWVVRFENTHYQIEKPSAAAVQPKQTIIVRRHLDESISLWSKKEKLIFKQLKGKPVKETVAKNSLTGAQRSADARRNKHKTPWGKFNPDWLKSKRTVDTDRI